MERVNEVRAAKDTEHDRSKKKKGLESGKNKLDGKIQQPKLCVAGFLCPVLTERGQFLTNLHHGVRSYVSLILKIQLMEGI